MEQNRTKKVRFDFLSNEAARLERAGSYKEAAEVWGKAESSASNVINQRWCCSRADFCKRMEFKPFKGE